MGVERRRRYRGGLVFAIAGLVGAVLPWPAVAATPDSPPEPPPPLSVLPPSPPPRPAGELADAGVAAAYEAWEEGKYRPTQGVTDNRLRVEIETVEGGAADAAALAKALDSRKVSEVTSTLLVADVPFEKLVELQDDPSIIRVGLQAAINPTPINATGRRGGDILAKTNAGAWHGVGYTGAGVKIAIVDRFDPDALNAAVAAGEIRSSALQATFCLNGGVACNIWAMAGTDGQHGVAVAEALSDMAPDAQLYLATVNSLPDLRNAIDYFASVGVKIISRSLGAPYDGPGDGTGESAKLIDYAVSKGIAWFNSAGNHGIRTEYGRRVGGYWRSKWIDAGNDGWLDFTDSTGKVGPSHYLPVTCGWFGGLRWNDWGQASATDYNLFAYSAPSGTQVLLASSTNNQAAGARPLEGTDAVDANGSTAFNRIDCTKYPYYYLAIQRNGPASLDEDILEIQVYLGLWDYPTMAGSAGQAFADTRNAGAAAVGAVDPVDGVTIAGYSSRGPSNDGRIKPDLSAGSGFASLSYPTGFNGTSAATPVVAGAAALVWQAAPGFTPAQVVGYLKQQAVVDRGDPGPDNTYGVGELRLRNFEMAAGTPTISGAAKVGATLTANPGAWTSGTGFAYQWLRNGTAIPGATKALYALVSADHGTRISVRVTGSRTGYDSVSRESGQIGPIATGTLLTATPRIVGQLAVGQKVTADPGSWTKGTTFTYQWYANGKAIKGAKGKTLKLSAAMKGRKLRVEATGSQVGYATAATSSASSQKVLVAKVPKASGTTRVGKTLTAATGGWTSKVKFSYRWLRNGKPISGATQKKYKLKSADAGKKITVRVTGKRSGYATVTLTSKPTGKIRK